MWQNNSENRINFECIDSKQKHMTYYRTRQEAESHRTRKGERIYYEAGKGWYIIRPKVQTDPSGNVWHPWPKWPKW